MSFRRKSERYDCFSYFLNRLNNVSPKENYHLGNLEKK